MKLTITGGLLEHIRDALDDVVEGNAPALVGMDLTKATLVVDDGRMPDLRIIAPGGDMARYRARDGQWERCHYCDDCDAEEWSEHAEWDHHCTTQPACCDSDYRDE